MNEKRVLVGMSGGVDSSVAAALLKEQGYDVIGITITPFKIDPRCQVIENERGCCSYKSTIDAAQVCEKIGIKHQLVDLTDLFQTHVVDYFVNEYLNGRTPNPCIVCNPIIKWAELLKVADKLDAKYLATGHYANIEFSQELNRYYLRKGIDSSKDQSYFLWKLSQEQLARTLFPLGHLEKTETREIAEKYNLSISRKPDSQEVCFIPDNDYHHFLNTVIDNIDDKIKEGSIIFHDKVFGKHKGLPFYTVGQRKGLGVTYKDPLYVKNISPDNNTIEIGTKDELYSSGLYADDINLIKYNDLNEAKLFTVKIRYRDVGSDAYCKIETNGVLRVDFIEKKRSITPGQSVVMFEDDTLVGGAVIRNSF